MKPEIHNFKKRYETAYSKLDTSGLSKHNIHLIKEYDQQLVLDKISLARREKIIYSLKKVGLALNTEFDKATKEDLKKFVIQLEKEGYYNSRKDKTENYSEWTRQSYRAIIKKFYKWLEYGDEYNSKLNPYPEKVRWINAGLRKKDEPKLDAGSILTEKEVYSLINACKHPRDKAIISILYETGTRISEIGNLQIKNKVKDKKCYLLDVKGKTGQRTPIIIFSVGALKNWLSIHPFKDDPEAPLWVRKNSSNPKNPYAPMNYNSFSKLISTLKKECGIKKKITPHIFRHSRATHLLRKGEMNEAQVKIYFGWTPSSDMLERYSHLTSADANEMLKKIYGIETTIEEGKEKEVVVCGHCKAPNPIINKFCGDCSNALTIEAIEEQKRIEEDTKDLLLKLWKKNIKPEELEQLKTMIN